MVAPRLSLRLIGIESFLLEDASLDGGIVAGARLLQTDHGVLHVDAHLIGGLLEI